MGFYTDIDNGFTVYDVPKGGGTTIRMWITYALTGQIHLDGSIDYYYGDSEYYNILGKCGYSLDWFHSVDGARICIKRDPVERFVSCYDDKIIREGHLNNCNIDSFLDDFYEIMNGHNLRHPFNPNVGYLWYHFAPQFEHLGDDIGYYDKVFDIKDVGSSLKEYLESKWHIYLPDLKCRNNPTKLTRLNNSQIEKIKKIYKCDYDIGWY